MILANVLVDLTTQPNRYFERLVADASNPHLVGDSLTYADLAAMHVIDGLKFAYPNAMAALFDSGYPKLNALYTSSVFGPFAYCLCCITNALSFVLQGSNRFPRSNLIWKAIDESRFRWGFSDITRSWTIRAMSFRPRTRRQRKRIEAYLLI